MLLEKERLTLDDLEAQAALELPNRDMMLVTVIINNVLNGLHIDVDVRNVNVAVQVCDVVNLINTIIAPDAALTCTIQQ